MVGVAALVALAVSGTGVLLPGADESSPTGALRIAGLTAAGLGVAALVVQRRRNPVNRGSGADPTAAGLATAALVMGLLALLSLPTSEVHFGEGDDTVSDPGGSGPGNVGGSGRRSEVTTTTTSSTTSATGPRSTSGNGGPGRPVVTEDMMFTVAIDHETGHQIPVAIDSANNRMLALDPETGEVRGMSLTPSASDGSGGFGPSHGSGSEGTGLSVVMGVDSRTGEAGIVGVTDPGTGEIGIVHEMDTRDVVATEPAGTVLIEDGGHIVDLDLEAAVDDATDGTGGSGSGASSSGSSGGESGSGSRSGGSGSSGGSGTGGGDRDVQPLDFSDFDFSGYITDDTPSIGTTGRTTDLERVLEQRNPAEAFDSVPRSQLEEALRDADEQARERSSDEGDSDAGDDSDEEDSGWFSFLGIEFPEIRLPDVGDMSFDPGLLIGVLAAVVLAVAAMCALQLLTRPKARGTDGAGGGDEEAVPEPPPVAAGDAEAGLVASLDEAQESGDPRQRIMAAYMRLLEALAAAGAPRRLEEAPHEHLHRVLGPLGVRPGPVHELAELFVLARFGNAPVTDEHRQAAVTALETSLADLRAAVGPLVEEGAAAPTAPGAPAGGIR